MHKRSDTAPNHGLLFATALLLALALAFAVQVAPANAHSLTDAEDPQLAGDSAAHAKADAIDVQTAKASRKMMQRINRKAKARAKKRRALGLPVNAAQLSDQGIRERGLLQMLGFDVSLTALSLFDSETTVPSKDPTAASAPATRAAQTRLGAGPQEDGMWGPVLWPIYQVKPGDPDYDPVANAGPTPSGSGLTPSPAGNAGDTPAAPGSANNPNPRIVPVFEALLPDGKVIYWDWLISGWFKDGTPQQSTRILLWDPMHPNEPGQRIDVLGANLFCAGYSHLPNGDLFLAGGNANNAFHGLDQTFIYHWRTKTWEQGPDMTRLRWYPSVASMYNGEQMILGGDPPGGYGNPAQTADPATRAVPEVYSSKYVSPATQQLNSSNDTVRQLENIRFGNDTSGPGGSDAINPPSSRGYPFLVPSVDGRVLYAGYESETYLVDSTAPDTGTGASAGFGAHDPFWRVNGSFVNYDIGKVLLFGGGTSAKYGTPPGATYEDQTSCNAANLVGESTCQQISPQEGGATKKPTYIDLINSNSGVGWTEDEQGTPGSGTTPYPHPANDMAFNRRFDYSTVLPDGKILITGGISNTDPDNGDNAADDDFNNNLINLDPNDVVKAAELFDPTTETFTTLASAAITRQYHSTAMLLPDATVLTGGGGVCGACTTQGEHYYNPNFEIFKPPYLFNSNGTEAIRPAITTPTFADSTAQVLPPVDYDKGFQISYTPGKDQNGADRNVQKATLLKLGTPTHSTDVGQRYIPLEIVANDIPNRVLTLNAPLNSYIAPPGYYMLFLVDEHGTPSISKMIQVGARLALNNKSSVARVYRDSTFVGTTQYLGIGEYTQSYGNFANVGNNGISSIQVDPGYQALVCKNANGTDCTQYTSNQASLGGFNEAISYIKVTPIGEDMTAPAVAITSPANGSTVTSSAVQLLFTATDAGGAPTCNRVNGETLNLQPGSNTIVLSCYDSNFNITTVTSSVTYVPTTGGGGGGGGGGGAQPALAPPLVKLAKSLKLASSFSIQAKCTSTCWAEAIVIFGKKKMKVRGISLKVSASSKKLTFKLTDKQLRILKKAKKKRQKISLKVTLYDLNDQSTTASAKIK